MRIHRSLFKPIARHEYKIENKVDESTVYLYDEISFFGIDSEQFVKDFNAITAKTIHLRVNSPGGAVFDGLSIYNMIEQHKSRVIAHIDGLCASIASVIVMAADEVRMSENAFLMIHKPWAIIAGGADELRREADLIDKIGGSIVKSYMDKTGKTEDEIKSMMEVETWMTAQEALDGKFIDAIDKNEKQKKAQVPTFDLSAFANVPDALKEKRGEPTIRDTERILRDAGFSDKKAKEILAKGYAEGTREAEPAPEPVAKVIPIQREVEPEKPKKDRVADLLTRAEILAPTIA